MGIGATFRGSEFMSPLTGPESLVLLPSEHPELFKHPGFQQYISRVSGKRLSQLRKIGAFTQGIEWKRGQSYLGSLSVVGGPEIAGNISVVSTGPRRTGTVLEWFARALGVREASFLRDVKETDKYLRPAWMVAGADASKGKLAAQYANAAFSWAMGRMNLLLTSPFDLEVMHDVAKQIPILSKINLGVTPGTGTQMLWRYAKKAAIALAAYKALSYTDYLAREHGLAAAVPAGAVIGGAAGLAYGLKMGARAPGKYAAIGAGVGALLGLGPFRHGPISGLAEAYAGIQISRASISSALGLTDGAKKTEDFFPGLTKPTTMIAMAGSGLLMGGAYEWGKKLLAIKKMAGTGTPPGSGAAPGWGAVRGIYETVDKDLTEAAKKVYDNLGNIAARQGGLSKIVTQIKQRLAGSMKKGEFTAAGASKYAAIGAGLYGAAATVGSFVSGDIVGGLIQGAATAAAAFAFAKKGPTLALGLLSIPFLRTKEEPEELKRVYSGEELVPVRAGRWWEAGKTPYEGGRPYYRPHRVAMMRSGAQEAALYGSEEKAWETDPFLHPLRFLMDPYAREKLMWEQGYRFPMSKTPFEDFPIVGPLLAGTIGRIIKPPKFLGREQWIAEKSEEGPRGMRETLSEEPISRVGIKGTVGEQLYRLSELSGLPGFVLSSLKGKVTGTETFFEQTQWATPSLVSGVEPAWWSLELGGMALLSEGIRRYIPHKRNEIEYRNPLPSGLPSWLPGPDSQYFMDFSTADIYQKIKEPWARLPGKGFSQLHPELQGVAPEDYSPFWRYKVLCLDENTEILTPNGIVLIRDLSKGDFVYGSDGKPKEVIEVLRREGIDDRYKIKTFYNETPLVCSGQHKVLITGKNRTLREVEAKEITKDDYLVLPINQYPLDETTLCVGDYCDVRDVDIKYENGVYKAHVKGSQRSINFNIPANFKVGRAFGLFLAEGGAYNSAGNVVWSLHAKEKDTYGKEIREFIELFGIPWTERDLFESHSYQVHANNKLLARLLCSMFGNGALHKEIKFDVSEMPRGFVLGLVDGYFNGDGNICVQETSITLRATSVSKKLLDQLRIILASLGIVSSIRERKGKYLKTKGAHKAWVLDISRKYIKDLPSYSSIDFSNHKYKETTSDKFSFVTDKYVAFRIRDVEVESGNSSVWYDLSINDPDGTHCFTTISGLVHNSDVAPWSREYGAYNRVMSKYINEKRLSPEKILEVQAIRKRVNEVKKAKDFQQYRYNEDAIQKMRVKITEELEPGVYLTDTFGKAPIVMSGIDTSKTSLASVAMQRGDAQTASAAFQVADKKRVQLSDYLRQYVRPGSEVDVFVHRDPSLMYEYSEEGTPQVQAVVSAAGRNLNRALLERGLAQEQETSKTLDATMATSGIQRGFGALWERFTHQSETPLETFTPFAPTAKFIHQRSALEEYQRDEVYGKEVGMWQTPIRSFLAPGLSTTAFMAGWRGIPREVRERYMIDEYFDRLEYMKWKRLESAARARGESELATKYSKQIAATKVGADIYSDYGPLLAMSSKEKSYFREFVESPTAAERREISNVVSPQMREILHAQWAKRAAEAASARLDAGTGGDGDLASINRFYAMRGNTESQRRHAANEAANAQMPVPNPSWIGWDPSSDVQDYKVKTVQEQGLDLSAFGMWDSDVRRVQRRPWVHSMSVAINNAGRAVPSPGVLRRRFSSHTGMQGSRPIDVSLTGGDDRTLEVRSPGYDRLSRYMNDPSIMQF